MKLGTPPSAYDPSDQAQMRGAIERADQQNLKRGRDIEIGASRMIFTDDMTGDRYACAVISGVWTLIQL